MTLTSMHVTASEKNNSKQSCTGMPWVKMIFTVNTKNCNGEGKGGLRKCSFMINISHEKCLQVTSEMSGVYGLLKIGIFLDNVTSLQYASFQTHNHTVDRWALRATKCF